MSSQLYLRPGERVKFYREFPDERANSSVYAVSVIETPLPPGPSHPEAQPKALICMGYYECSESEIKDTKLWGWMSIPDRLDRDMIADALEENGIGIGEWTYIKIGRDEDG